MDSQKEMAEHEAALQYWTQDLYIRFETLCKLQQCIGYKFVVHLHKEYRFIKIDTTLTPTILMIRMKAFLSVKFSKV